MKVLWFSNSPGNAVELLDNSFVGSSWVPSMDKKVQHKIELHVAFYYPKRNVAFKYLETTYHPIGSNKHWRLKALFRILFGKIIYKQDLNRYLEIVNQVKPEIIHIHGTENPFGSIIQNVKIPIVVSIQGCLTVIEHKYKNGFTNSSLLFSRYSIPGNLKYFLTSKSFMKIFRELKRGSKNEKQYLRDAKYIMGRTAWDRRITSVLSPQSTYYHCDEMMRDIFYEKVWKYSNNCLLVLHSTINDSPYKGFETICETLYELRRIPGIKVEWQIAGLSDDASIVKITKRRLKTRYPACGLIFLGQLGEIKLAEKMCSANIFVSPSHIENSSNSLCEAMLLGMPCIATYAGGTGSLLEDGVDGILIQDGDPWSMAGAVLQLYFNPGIAQQFGSHARKRAMERHDRTLVSDRLIDIYLQILNKNLRG